MRIKGLIVFLVCVSIVLGVIFIKKSPKEQQNNTFFLSVPSVTFSPLQMPCLPIEIGNKKFIAGLDLGFTGEISMTSKPLETITEKSLIGKKIRYGYQGKKYEKNVYQIPTIGIGDILIKDNHLEEGSYEFEEDAIIEPSETPCDKEVIRLGWKLFQNTNLFLDLDNSIIAFCDSFETFQSQFPYKKFIKLPLIINTDTETLQIETIIDNRPVRCLIDTGATWNILSNDSSLENCTTDDISSLSLQINGHDFGSTIFHNLSIAFSDKIPAIIGMDFFLEHQIYIDFPNKEIYISLEN